MIRRDRIEIRPLTNTARRGILRNRRLVAGSLAAAGTACAVVAMQPASARTESVLAAARDLPAGPLSPQDITRIALPPSVVPRGVLRSGDAVRGAILTAPMRKGEPLTDRRILGPGLLAGHPEGTVAVPLRIADAAAVRLVSPGDVIDILATPTGGDGVLTAEDTFTAAKAITVITVPRADGASSEGAPLVVATRPEQASGLAQAQGTARLSLTIRPRSR